MTSSGFVVHITQEIGDPLDGYYTLKTEATVEYPDGGSETCGDAKSVSFDIGKLEGMETALLMSQVERVLGAVSEMCAGWVRRQRKAG